MSASIIADERELKMICDEGFDRQALIAMLRGLGELSGRGVAEVVDTYLDTRSGSLGRAGLVGRHRRRDGKHSLQLKTEPLIPELIFSRPEISSPLRRPGEAGGALRELAEQRLPIRLRGVPVPEVQLRSRREVMTLSTSAYRAEVSIDQVAVRRPRARSNGASFAELELELLGGEVQAFDMLCGRIAELPGLKASKKSKHKRALELLGLPAPRLGAPPVSFDAATPADVVARASCRAQLKAMLSYESGTRLGLDPEFLHKMRVATRRLRAALRTFAGCFAARDAQHLAGELRWLAGELGQLRDLDVHLMDTFVWQQELGPKPDEGWDELRRVLRQRRASAHARVTEALDSARYRRLCQRAERVFGGDPPRRRRGHPGAEPVAGLAGRLVARRARQVERGVEACRGGTDPAAVHALRIRGKKLRYTAELFRPLYDEAFRQQLGALAGFQDRLGRFQDAVVAGELGRQLRDEAFAEGAAPAYLYVIGRLVTWAEMTADQAEQQALSAYREVGGRKLLRRLRRAAKSAAAALAEGDKEDEKALSAAPRKRRSPAARRQRQPRAAAGEKGKGSGPARRPAARAPRRGSSTRCR